MAHFKQTDMQAYLQALAGNKVNPIDLPVPLFGVDDGYDQINVSYWVADENGLSIGETKIKSRARRGIHVHGTGGQGIGIFYTGNEPYTVRDTLFDHEDTRSDDYPRTALNRILLHAGLNHAGIQSGQGVAVVTGLPAKFFYSDVNQTGMNDRLIEDKTDNIMTPVEYGTQKAPGARVLFHGVFPEAIAGMVDYLYDNQGHAREGVAQDETLMGLDIGGNTTDLVIMAPGFEVLQKETIRFGVSHMRDRMRGLLENHLGYALDNVLLDQAMSARVIQPMGERIDVSTFWHQAVNDVLVDILGETERFRRRFPSIAGMVCFGGGAALCAEVIREKYPTIKMMDNPDGANSRGFLKLATLDFLDTIRETVIANDQASPDNAVSGG